MKRLLFIPIFLLATAALAGSNEHSVNLDVKDQEIRVILESMRQQCKIKNLIIDPDVQGQGTFYFRDVPCKTAFDIVLRTMGLKAEELDGSVVTVERRR